MNGFQNIPSLNALRAFEAAARHLSFKKAAEELRVSPGAVARFVKILEAHFGRPLFVRYNRMIELTPEGEVLLPEIQDGLRSMLRAASRVEQYGKDRAVVLRVGLSIGEKWLMPVLAEFAQTHPEVRIRLEPEELSPEREPNFDIQITYGPKVSETTSRRALFDDVLVPVCIPPVAQALRAKGDELRFDKVRLIHTDAHRWFEGHPDWSGWLTQVGYSTLGSEARLSPDAGLQVAYDTLAIQAALRGQGVALVSSILVERELATGSLVNPTGRKLPIDLAYIALQSAQGRAYPKASEVFSWIVKAARAI